MNRVKVERIVNMIKCLTVEELVELNKKLSQEGGSPISSGVPAKPKPSPLSLDAEAVIGTNLEGEPLTPKVLSRRLR